MSTESTELSNPLTAAERSSLMDLDPDLDGPWQFDHIFFVNPTSPFSPPSSDQPGPPLLDCSDDRDDEPAGNSASPSGGSTRLFYNCREVSCNPDSVTGSLPRIGGTRRLPPPSLGLTPLNYPDWSCVIKERMAQALRYFKESTEQHVLAQVWAPVKRGGRYVLTTSGQPFVLDPRTNGLHQYRMVSLMYMFSVDGEDGGALGLPGRVFQKKLPEWTPNVQYYSTKEYPRLSHALVHNVQGSLALPVFEPSGESCVGVLELIMTSPKINYAPEVDKVCKALEAVNLRSSEILDHPTTQVNSNNNMKTHPIVFSFCDLTNACFNVLLNQICNEGRQKALAEILEILTVVCETHKLPLAQTWVPCRHRSVLAIGGGLKKSCSSFDGSCMGQICMSTTDVAVYVVDAHMWGFREACAEHHLQKGQGVAGRAFASQNSSFCEDITQFSKTEYPLVHYARMFGLTSAFAICLQSTHTRNDDYILEFFLPPDIGDKRDQLKLLGSILVTVKQHHQSLKVASSKEHEGEVRCVEIIKASMGEILGSEIESVQVLQSAIFPPGPVTLQNGPEMELLDSPQLQLRIEVDSITSGGSIGEAGEIQNGVSFPGRRHGSKKSERKRGKAEKSISLEVLQQHFAGSLKDAAKSLGVCRTTMKRICRQHGISRWPSRKINKVSRSLSKLQRVMESVPGTGGEFKLASLAASSLPVAASLDVPNRQNAAGSKPPNLGEEKHEFMTPNESGSQHHEGSSPSKSGSGLQEESCGTPTSDGSSLGVSCLGNQHSSQNDLAVSPLHEKHVKVCRSIELTCQPAATFFTPAANVTTQSREKIGGTLIEDAGSPHDISPAAVHVLFDDRVPLHSELECREGIVASTDRMPHILAGLEMETVTIKATYNDDIIRFRLSLDSGIAKLKEEVSKRLKVDMGTFDIKYLDDDNELVLITCDADLLECVDVSNLSGSKIIRLSIHDVMANLGSSIESLGQ
ncbi:protein NLP6-like isoform X3 [Rhododendron vialii]|uniref:protein NLP6-like isoform X3 n=1 Tax=Rhododendron vialii TaxID=182163 RepID=UPI00265E9A35|nr:protein NLP6-like isoform X3 [Rhododendron vialii]